MALSTTTRVESSLTRMEDGFVAHIAPAADADISFWEVSVTPPGIDGGEPINTTTQFNSAWRSMAPRALKTLTPMQVSAAYNPKLYDEILALVNVVTSWTITWPDGATLDFFGFLQTFAPQQIQEGTMPLANITITPTNIDPSDGSETAPNYKTPSGTD